LWKDIYVGARYVKSQTVSIRDEFYVKPNIGM